MTRNMKRALWGTTGLCLAWLAATPATAEDATDGFLGTIQLGESKREVRTDTATAITEIDETEIKDRQAGTIAELIDSVPGVALVNGSTPQGSGINIRGFGANSTFGTDQKVKIIVDGAETGAEELYRIGNQLFTDPMLYKKVEVLRGTVGSFEYGSGVVGGIVKLETKDASDFTGGVPGFAARQTLEFSTNGNGIVSSTILAWQPTDRAEFLLNYTYRDQGTQEDGDGNPIGNSAFDTPSWLAKAKFYLDAAREHTLTFSATDTQSADRDVPYDTFGTSGGVFGNVDRDTRSRTATAKYNYNPAGNDLLDLDVILSYADQKIDQEYVPGSSPVAPPGGFDVVNADHRYETTKLTVKNTGYFDTGAVAHELRTGVEYIHKERKTANSAPGGRDIRFALFAIDEVRIGDAWTVTPAIRYEAQTIYDDTTAPLGTGPSSYDNDALMGGLSVRYAFGNGFAAFGSAAYTENLPIMDDLYNPFTNAPQPTLMNQSEKSHTFEIGGSYDGQDVFAEGDDLAVKITLYDTELWDVTSFSGVDRVELQGVEIEGSYAMASGFYADLNATLPYGDQFTTAGVKNRWRNLAAESARLTVGKKWADAYDLSWEVVAANSITVPTNTVTPHSPTHITHNLRATVAPETGIWEGTEFRVGIENLFDEDYQPHLSTRDAPGRNFKFTIAKTF